MSCRAVEASSTFTEGGLKLLYDATYGVQYSNERLVLFQQQPAKTEEPVLGEDVTVGLRLEATDARVSDFYALVGLNEFSHKANIYYLLLKCLLIL